MVVCSYNDLGSFALKLSNGKCLVAAVLLLILVNRTTQAQEEPMCVENSPERRGEIGCSIVEIKQLPALKEPVFWHIDRFDTGERARTGVGPASMAFEAHGAWWLMSIEPQTGEMQADNHHGGEHVARVKLSPLPEAANYSMLVISAYIPSGMTSRVHLHSGVEAFYVVDGEQCLQTEERSFPMQKGETLVVPAGVTMRLIATGTKPRRAFAVIVYDSSKPPTTRMPMERASELASCTK
jgi:quercetin dioxygenase-like cupin family protein